MVDEIRSKWCEDLEDLVQCPICMERPRNAIYQCVQGHHVCQFCKPQLAQCPTCAERWSASRNRFAEHLCSKLDEIKTSLIDPENEINKLLIPDKVSVASQTDGPAGTELAVKKKPVDAHNNKTYNCMIGSCNIQKTYDQMLRHFVKDHNQKYSELASDGAIFEHSWTFHFTPELIFDRVFLIADMGAFFLKLSTDMFGNFTGFVAMIHNGFIAKHFTYQLEVSCCADHKCSSYKGEVCSCRTPSAVFLEKSLHIDRQEMQKMCDHRDDLICTLLLGKKPVTEQPPPEQAAKEKNVPRKRLPKRNPQAMNPVKNNQQIEPSNGEPTQEYGRGMRRFTPVFNRK